MWIVGALAALEDEDHHRRVITVVRQERQRLTEELLGLGWVVSESQANFISCRPPAGSAAEAAALLREDRILVRHFPIGRFGDQVRISVGLPEENDRLLDALGRAAERVCSGWQPG